MSFCNQRRQQILVIETLRNTEILTLVTVPNNVFCNKTRISYPYVIRTLYISNKWLLYIAYYLKKQILQFKKTYAAKGLSVCQTL